MEVGQTTTLLNSFVNYLLGIEIEEDFRYVIIHETFGISQSVSQTSKVTIYNIKGMNGLPPIQIIDNPRLWRYSENKRGYENTSKIELSTNILMFDTV